ncbi:retrovirus-related pol polyprotein from transposon tnt 1-94 [Cucumis melo var. makuwa]|uniref:Retrovirus-related pol polyprotein from transposon tnt 1-94 n=1 Tax=Cucumis melo var. makuwa TaxID=1194695 RepID=A0A5A7UHS3_CUCMM|nr:retrovirus-related pol polyprotein from transposon tnt 1-94 [Cucumis melo var. makuwa]
MRDYMLVYGVKDLILIRYIDSYFQIDKDYRKSTLGLVFTLNEGVVPQMRKILREKVLLDTEIMERGDVIVTKIASEHNIVGPFTKILTTKVFEDAI